MGSTYSKAATISTASSACTVDRIWAFSRVTQNDCGLRCGHISWFSVTWNPRRMAGHLKSTRHPEPDCAGQNARPGLPEVREHHSIPENVQVGLLVEVKKQWSVSPHHIVSKKSTLRVADVLE